MQATLTLPQAATGGRVYQPLFSRRLGFRIYWSGLHFSWQGERNYRHRVSWPLGKITLHRDHLELGSFFHTHRLAYKEIDRIERAFLFMARIVHHSPTEPDVVLLSGWFVLSDLRNAATRLGLPLRFAG